jgi:LemA protein
VLAVVILVIVITIIGVRNHAIGLEEHVNDAQAQVEAQEKRRVDLVYNLVDVVKNYADYEHDTQMDVIAARTANGTIDQEGGATVEINALAEAYPDLKASEQYKQLMTELATTENLIFTYRSSYNDSVREYRSFTRKWPASMILGGDVVDFQYLEFDAPSDAPQDLFED